MQNTRSLRVPGNLDSLEALRDFTKEAAEAAGLDKKARYRLMLAVDEVATNIIVHGYEEAGLSGEVEIIAELKDSALVVTLIDRGTAFDDSQHATPANLDAPLEERDVGGLGVFLALEGVDEFHYQRLEDRNIRTFVVKRSSGAKTA